MHKDIMTGIVALAIIDILTDIAFLYSIFGNEEVEDTDADKHPLIGRRYIVKDNSYAIDKETGVEVSGVANKEYVIVSDPYVEEIKSNWTDKTYKHLFVDVFSLDSARKYRVLFQENGVVAED